MKTSEAYVVIEWYFGRESIVDDRLYLDDPDSLGSYDAAREAARLNSLHQTTRYSSCQLSEYLKANLK